ncbi:hypothetical protein HYH03_008740 [Edaphochlamys debaryana]|uniref:Myb-like domain-containing protein n=1 Tax=Edaphochlamys debaryana TaxID=47281 RepID=A0A836BYK9_9CHLO|nr:hypothetical protein HYH03_008740 [Edaphochlamys debaryana]|eukprot:KAG2493077.1 hypothetical protein HYH03_008740 [Edaphochlamys debaryana]
MPRRDGEASGGSEDEDTADEAATKSHEGKARRRSKSAGDARRGPPRSRGGVSYTRAPRWTVKWSSDDFVKLAKLHVVHGNQWKAISLKFKNRTPIDVKNIYYSSLRCHSEDDNEGRTLLRVYIRLLGDQHADAEARRAALRTARQQCPIQGRASGSAAEGLEEQGQAGAESDGETIDTDYGEGEEDEEEAPSPLPKRRRQAAAGNQDGFAAAGGSAGPARKRPRRSTAGTTTRYIDGGSSSDSERSAEEDAPAGVPSRRARDPPLPQDPAWRGAQGSSAAGRVGRASEYDMSPEEHQAAAVVLALGRGARQQAEGALSTRVAPSGAGALPPRHTPRPEAQGLRPVGWPAADMALQGGAAPALGPWGLLAPGLLPGGLGLGSDAPLDLHTLMLLQLARAGGGGGALAGPQGTAGLRLGPSSAAAAAGAAPLLLPARAPADPPAPLAELLQRQPAGQGPRQPPAQRGAQPRAAQADEHDMEQAELRAQIAALERLHEQQARKLEHLQERARAMQEEKEARARLAAALPPLLLAPPDHRLQRPPVHALRGGLSDAGGSWELPGAGSAGAGVRAVALSPRSTYALAEVQGADAAEAAAYAAVRTEAGRRGVAVQAPQRRLGAPMQEADQDTGLAPRPTRSAAAPPPRRAPAAAPLSDMDPYGPGAGFLETLPSLQVQGLRLGPAATVQSDTVSAGGLGEPSPSVRLPSQRPVPAELMPPPPPRAPSLRAGGSSAPSGLGQRDLAAGPSVPRAPPSQPAAASGVPVRLSGSPSQLSPRVSDLPTVPSRHPDHSGGTDRTPASGFLSLLRSGQIGLSPVPSAPEQELGAQRSGPWARVSDGGQGPRSDLAGCERDARWEAALTAGATAAGADPPAALGLSPGGPGRPWLALRPLAPRARDEAQPVPIPAPAPPVLQPAAPPGKPPGEGWFFHGGLWLKPLRRDTDREP